METTRDFLDRLKAKYVSDYMTAKMLQVTQSSVSHWRSGLHLPDVRAMMKIAEHLELDPAYVMACVNAQRAEQRRPLMTHKSQRDGLKAELEQWSRIAEKFRDAAVVAALAIGAGLTAAPSPATAGTSHKQNSAHNDSAIHIVRRRRPPRGGSSPTAAAFLRALGLRSSVLT